MQKDVRLQPMKCRDVRLQPIQCCDVLQVLAAVNAVHAPVLADAEGCPQEDLGGAGCYQGDLGGWYQGDHGGEEERSHTDPTTTLVWVGLWQALTGLIPTRTTCIKSPSCVTYVTNSDMK